MAWMAVAAVRAQQERTWEQVWQEVMEAEDMDEADWNENFEHLEQLAEHPIDLNRATREELEQLPFLSSQQVMDLMEYLYRYGPMRSLGELRMVTSLDYQQIALLPYFVYAGEVAVESYTPSLDTIVRRGHHTLTLTGRVPFYERRGDDNGYLGYRYRHSLRYEFKSGDYVRAGLVGAQDAGEPFLASRNRWGYDTYSYYVQLRKMGRIETVVVGKYKASAGMGLVLNTSFRPGKLATLQSLGRQSGTLRPHSSRSEADYFQGAAASVSLSRPLTLTVLLSYRPTDATLSADGSATTLVTDGYHRTEAEMEKKYNTHQAAAGARLAFRQGGFHLSGNAVYTHLDRLLAPDRKTLYRRHYPYGRNFMNASLDYGFTHHRVSLSGETAVNQDGAVATVHAVSFQPSATFSLMMLQRFYSYRYSGLYTHGFGENSRGQNESGLFLGATWNPLARLHLQAYADYAYFPWARYQVSQSSHACDFFLQSTYQWQRWSLLGRARMRFRQRDDESGARLVANNDYRARLALSFRDHSGWNSKTQLDWVRTFYLKTEQGWMLSEQVSLQRQRWMASLSAALFDTDSYNSRIYAHERQMAHEFYLPSFSGEGLRLAFLARADVSSRLRLALRLGYTGYFDRPVIGTGLQQIPHSHQTDLDLQLRWQIK
jgi:hypothetical protein